MLKKTKIYIFVALILIILVSSIFAIYQLSGNGEAEEITENTIGTPTSTFSSKPSGDTDQASLFETNVVNEIDFSVNTVHTIPLNDAVLETPATNSDRMSLSLNIDDTDSDEDESDSMSSEPSEPFIFQGSLLYSEEIEEDEIISDFIMKYDIETETYFQLTGCDDGTNRKPENEDHSPKYSPDGKLIAFSRAESDSMNDRKSMKIFVMKSDDTGKITKVAERSKTSEFEFTPDSKGITYISDDYQVKLINLENLSESKFLTNDRIGSKCLPVISSDYKYLYFASTNTNQYTIYRKELGDFKSKPEIVFESRKKLNFFKLSPNRTELLISEANLKETSDVFVYNMIFKRIIHPFGDLNKLHGAFWSTDGKQIFAVISGNNPGLISVNIENLEEFIVEMVIENFYAASSVSLEPIGTPSTKLPRNRKFEQNCFQDTIIYSTQTNEPDPKTIIESLNLSTMVRKQFTRTNYDPDRLESRLDIYPKCSPNGEIIAFGRNSKEHSKIKLHYDIFIMKANGTDIQKTYCDFVNSSYVFTPDSKSIIFHGLTSKIKKYNFETQEETELFKLKINHITTSLALTANGRYLYYTDESKIYRKDLENLRTYYPEWSIDTNSLVLNEIKLSPSEDKILLHSKTYFRDNNEDSHHVLDIESRTVIDAPKDLKEAIWDHDGSGIYATKLNDNPGLFHFKLENNQFLDQKLVVSDFGAASYISLQSKTVENSQILDSFDDSLIYASKHWPNSIMQFDAETKKTEKLTKPSKEPEIRKWYTDHDPKLSPNRDQVGFCRMPHSLSFENPVIYVMDSDGNNLRKIVECKNETFNFSSDGTSIIYLDINGRIRKISLETGLVTQIVENDSLPTRDEVNKGYGRVINNFLIIENLIYYALTNGHNLKLFRRDYNDKISESELVYHFNCTRSNETINEFQISPSGTELIISLTSTLNSKHTSIFMIKLDGTLDNENGVAYEIKNLDGLEGFFWSQDERWIYAERTEGNVGLVRFNSDYIIGTETEMIIPFFESDSKAIILPK